MTVLFKRVFRKLAVTGVYSFFTLYVGQARHYLVLVKRLGSLPIVSIDIELQIARSSTDVQLTQEISQVAVATGF